MAEQQLMLCRYHYDPLDRLTGLAPAGESDARLFYCKSRLTTQIQGALRHSFLHTEENLLTQQSASDTGMDTALLATDRQGSVLTPLKQAGQQALVYTAYGHHAPNSGLASLLGFNGERRDPVTGHYLLGNGYRAYNPVLMRFNSPDSLSPFGEGEINTYAYCQGDPISFRDPTGHIISAGYRSAIKVWVDPFEQAIRRRLSVARVAPSPRSANAVAVMPSTASATAVSGSPLGAGVPVLRDSQIPRPSGLVHRGASTSRPSVLDLRGSRIPRPSGPVARVSPPPRRSMPGAMASPTLSSSSSELELMSIRDPGVELLSERVIEVRRDGAQARRSFYRSDSSGTDGSD
ncbi:RHS repeat-associated core domain-containing protein [Pseudomonas sp. 21LCFQ02]|uniref:RHS repeat-associated core domain-containing protein n=1 Tax=Pseudomonas sp. 21LCFQ02 TaxID=2957505 RepID=UPI00209B410B|nr:RHS repeat-associated core domain-containing protein [Pseudomonas sp. 21LCFQ02]MCO8168568.1 RHS repeat-associated core domain-containing protein [Pseudomonas sp. 21LCFQ02]MCO8169673.1 RHS repeat-associated core domain-containing protein [Pseudomonas sp. 21LCFQ02]